MTTSPTAMTSFSTPSDPIDITPTPPPKRGPGRPRKYPITAATSSSPITKTVIGAPTAMSSGEIYELQKLLMKQKMKKYAKKYVEKEQQKIWAYQQSIPSTRVEPAYNEENDADVDNEGDDEDDDDDDNDNHDENNEDDEHADHNIRYTPRSILTHGYKRQRSFPSYPSSSSSSSSSPNPIPVTDRRQYPPSKLAQILGQRRR